MLPINKRQSTKTVRLSDYFDEETSSAWRNADNATRDAVKAAVGDFLVEQINKHLDRGESPVENGAYKRTLAKKKGQRGLPRISRLLEDGDMRGHITHQAEKGTDLRVGIFSNAPKLERWKSSGHNLGDSVTGVQRQFIPPEGIDFTKTIEDRILGVIRGALFTDEEE